ncbi:MAG: glycosyltransferase [Dokdonella sp.]
MTEQTPSNSTEAPLRAHDTVAPRFSIVIPTFNRRERVLRAIDHVLQQAEAGPVQIVVVDDGSTDGTADAIAQQYRGNSAIEVIVTANRGPSAARNTGIGLARGELVCFLDSDDWFRQDTLALVARVFERWPQLRFVSIEGRREPMKGPVSSVDNNGGIVRPDCPGWNSPGFRHSTIREETFEFSGSSGESECDVLIGDLFPAIVHGDMFYLSGLFIRREAIAIAGPFNEDYWLFEDWDFHARLCLQNPGGYVGHIGFCRETGSGDQLSRRMSMQRNAAMHLRILRNLSANAALERRSDYQSHVLRARADAHYWLGRCLLGGERPKLRQARKCLLASLRQGHKPVKSIYLIGMSLLHRTRAIG